MKPTLPHPPEASFRGLLARLARDRSGNVFAMLAASVVPVLGLVGGGIDMGRSYLAQTRLQQACDAGTLAARKALGSGSDAAATAKAIEIGQRFFDLNYRDGAYGSQDRTFAMTIEDNLAVSGEATVDVPTTVMALFGNETMDLKVACQAQINFANTDVMMVLDVTGSMRWTNAGDTMSRMDTMKSVVRSFHSQIEENRAPATRVRYGFVPYSTNVNVGGLLEDDWVVDEWTYQGRRVSATSGTGTTNIWRNWSYVSGKRVEFFTVSTYPATLVAGTTDQYECTQPDPAETWTYVDTVLSSGTEEWPAGTATVDYSQRVQNGSRYRTIQSGATCEVQRSDDKDFVQNFEFVVAPNGAWDYLPVTKDVTNWRAEATGCIEERDTYEIDDFDNVDLTRALDLDIDLVPTPGNPSTQWRPRYFDEVFVRAIREDDGTGTFSVAPVIGTEGTYQSTGDWWLSACPPPARKLTEMSDTDLNAFLATLTPMGATYHDTGMIWGGRLISQDGLFADENGDVPGALPTSRHLIFLTDGQTEPYDIAYSPYGIEPLDQRRWSTSSSLSLLETVEQRFLFTCNEIKKKNVTIWVIAFGTTLNPITEACATGNNHFEAANASELTNAFEAIANSIAELRISK